jgi:UDPglucose--hexose-1-phosphate uridylyltransferase
VHTLTGAITRRSSTLADGRELIYYDDADTRLEPERAIDLRPPTARPRVAEMRQDALTGEWVAIAAARQNRVMLPPKHLDPLAPSTPSNLTEVPSDYDVAVFENKSPSFGPDLAAAGTDPLAELAGHRRIELGRTATAIGRCEVVCFSPATEGSLSELPVGRVRTVIEALADRTSALSVLPGVQQVFPFENRGEAIGVTLHHPHGQIYAYPYITPRTQKLVASIESYGAPLFADILDFERGSDRVLMGGEHFTAFVPFAARWPVEVHLLPHRHVADLAETTSDERDELAVMYREVLRAIDHLYDSPTPYIASWHQAPVNVHRDDIRLMLQVTSPRRAREKLKFLAGSESAMGAFIGDVPPESIARSLRAAHARAQEQDV